MRSELVENIHYLVATIIIVSSERNRNIECLCNISETKPPPHHYPFETHSMHLSPDPTI